VNDVEYVDYAFVGDRYNNFLAQNGQGGSQWPMVNSSAVFDLAIDRAVPNSTLKDLLIVGGLAAAISAPLWGPPLVGALTKGASAVMAALQTLLAKAAANVASADSVKDKLFRYLLNPTHPIGREKAEFFRRALGFTQDNLSALARQIVFNPNTAIATDLTQYGQKFEQIINITGANGRLIDITTVWIKNLDGVYRLVTAIPTK
jgi:hypothetical protein